MRTSVGTRAAWAVAPAVLAGTMSMCVSGGAAAAGDAHVGAAAPITVTRLAAPARMADDTTSRTSRPEPTSTGDTQRSPSEVETGAETTEAEREPISRDKVIVRDEAPDAIATVEPDASATAPATTGAATSESSAPPATSVPTASATPTISPTTTTPTAPAATTATAIPVPARPTVTVTASGTRAPAPTTTTAASGSTSVAEPTFMRATGPFSPYPVPPDGEPTSAATHANDSTVPVLARGSSGMPGTRGVLVAAAPTSATEPVIGSTVLGLFGLSLVAAGATIAVAARTHARR